MTHRDKDNIVDREREREREREIQTRDRNREKRGGRSLRQYKISDNE